jgi:hypothetical protein
VTPVQTGLATVSDEGEADADDAGVGDAVEHPTKPKHARAIKLIRTNWVCATSSSLRCAIFDVQDAGAGSLDLPDGSFRIVAPGARVELAASGC